MTALSTNHSTLTPTLTLTLWFRVPTRVPRTSEPPRSGSLSRCADPRRTRIYKDNLHPTWDLLTVVFVFLLAAFSLLVVSAQANTNTAVTNELSRFWSPDDGWFDVSGFLDEKYGFLPV